MLEEPREHRARLGSVADQIRAELLVQKGKVACLHTRDSTSSDRGALSPRLEVPIASESRRSASIPVGATTRQDTQDVDDAGLGVALEAHPPVADPQAPFVSVRQLDDIASRRIAREPIEGTDDAALDRRVETLEIPPRPRRDDPTP